MLHIFQLYVTGFCKGCSCASSLIALLVSFFSPLSSIYILGIGTSMSKMTWRLFLGHRQKNGGEGRGGGTNFRNEKSLLRFSLMEQMHWKCFAKPNLWCIEKMTSDVTTVIFSDIKRFSSKPQVISCNRLCRLNYDESADFYVWNQKSDPLQWG